jgi:hypothetical protein
VTTAESVAILGKAGTIHLNGLNIDIIVTDVKQAYGRTRYQVTPAQGSGSIWVETVKIEEA